MFGREMTPVGGVTEDVSSPAKPPKISHLVFHVFVDTAAGPDSNLAGVRMLAPPR
jgi:hypothetical protein